MKDIFAKARIFIVATASRQGRPNGVPVGLARIISDEEIMLVDNLMAKTRQNIDENPVVAVTYWSGEDHYGYQVKGTARVEQSGQSYDDAVKWVGERGLKSTPKAVIIVKVEEGYYIGRGKDSSKNLM
jgi:predicted pyridoxine 5'-phosphate oxidase superfamily flavin-nucleotide-binding protein